MERNKICLVVGGSGGIGSEVCRLLAENGFSVAISYNLAKEKALNIKNELKKKGHQTCCVSLDVNQEKSVSRAVKFIEKSLKGKLLYFVYSPGDELFYKSFFDLNWQQVQKKIDIFARGSWYCMKALLPQMRAEKFGRVVLINSSFSWAVPPVNLAGYVIGKYAQQGVMKAAAVELGPEGITVNSVSPAMTQTDFISIVPEIAKKMAAAQNPLRRLAVPQDVANAVLFFLSSESSYITGVDLPIAGGAVMR